MDNLSILWGTTQSIESRRMISVRKSNRFAELTSKTDIMEETMAAIRNILNAYAKANSSKKVDIIIRNYPNFMGIVDGYTEGLRYMIENEKAFNRKKNSGDLGVRVQTSGKHSDITANSAINNVITRDAIIACDFSGDVLEGVDRGEEFQRDAFLLRTMRNDYELFNQQLGILDKEEAEVFVQFISKEKGIADIAEDKGIVYESAQKKIQRAKKR